MLAGSTSRQTALTVELARSPRAPGLALVEGVPGRCGQCLPVEGPARLLPPHPARVPCGAGHAESRSWLDPGTDSQTSSGPRAVPARTVSGCWGQMKVIGKCLCPFPAVTYARPWGAGVRGTDSSALKEQTVGWGVGVGGVEWMPLAMARTLLAREQRRLGLAGHRGRGGGRAPGRPSGSFSSGAAAADLPGAEEGAS